MSVLPEGLCPRRGTHRAHIYVSSGRLWCVGDEATFWGAENYRAAMGLGVPPAGRRDLLAELGQRAPRLPAVGESG